MYYSKSTGGFYSTDIHTQLFIERVTADEDGETLDRWVEPDPSGPIADAVEITAEEYHALIEGQSRGKRITADSEGRPILVGPKSLWTLEDYQNAKFSEIRSVYAAAVTAPVELDGVQWHGGLDSAIKLDNALRFSQNAGQDSIRFYDVNNEVYELPLADALQVVTAVAETYQQTLSKKQRLMRMIDKADTVAMVEAITW